MKNPNGHKPTSGYTPPPPSSQRSNPSPGWFTRIITRILAAAGLASMFEKQIEWIPIFQHLIDSYRTLVYPLWNALFFWLPFHLPTVTKDFFTLNCLLMTALSSSEQFSGTPFSLVAVFKDYFKDLGDRLRKARLAWGEKGKMTLIILKMLAITSLGIWFGIIFIALSWLLFLSCIVHSLREWLRASGLERKKNLKELLGLGHSLVSVCYGFVVILGLNYLLR